MANLAACPLLTEKQKYFHSICDWPLLAQSGLSKIHRLVGEKGCDPVLPFRRMIPPNLRLKCEGPSPVRNVSLAVAKAWQTWSKRGVSGAAIPNKTEIGS
jgi:hypothetical protein